MTNGVFDVNVSSTVQTVAANSVSSTASRTYAVQVDSSDNLVVNIPWTDTQPNTSQQIQDIVGGMVDGNVETNIAVTYDSSSGKLDFEVGQFNKNVITPEFNKAISDIDIKIADFLEEDRDNHIVMRDYDRPESTFLIDLNNFRNAVDVDYSVLNPGEENEDELFDSEYDPTNPNHVPGPGKKGGRGILFKCHKFLDGSAVTLNSVNNSVPYFNLKAVAGWGGLIPLLEVYDKLLNKQVAERGQFFTYKVLDEKKKCDKWVQERGSFLI